MPPRSDKPTSAKKAAAPLGVQPTGRLELTWRGKEAALLSHDEGRSYSWVSPDDYRVKEVRLLRDVPDFGKVGETAPDTKRATDNLLIRGDAQHALQALNKLPEFAPLYRGKVKLIYVDPPYNTGAAFGFYNEQGKWVEQYDDALEHSVWLTMMRDRLMQAKDLLAADGSIWVQVDDKEVHYLKVLMDEIFGRINFLASIVWQKSYSPKNDSKTPSGDHDTILSYALNKSAWSMNGLPRTEKNNAGYKNPDNDPRGPWKSDNYTAKSGGPSLRYPIMGPNGQVATPPPGRYWAYSQETHRANVADNLVWWGKTGTNGSPAYKRFLTDVGNTTPSSWWPHEEVGHNQDALREIQELFPGENPFATPKPEFLIQRIIHIASNPGDVVLDCFVGSGTTAAVAHKMGRRWVAVEWSAETLAKFTEPRLRKVVAGQDLGGTTEAVRWEGGGGFRVLDVGESMFQVDENDDVQLAGWVAGDALAEAVAAQPRIAFPYEKDGIFAGRRNNLRLVVVDGLLTPDIVEAVIGELPNGEKALIACTAAVTGIEAIAKASKRITSVRIIPASLVAAHERSSALRHAMEVQRNIEEEARKRYAATAANAARVAAPDGTPSLFDSEGDSNE